MHPNDPRHGTYAGACAHERAGTPLCPPCLEARRRYGRRSQKRAALGYVTRVPVGTDGQARILAARNRGATWQQIADQMGVSISTPWKWAHDPHSLIPLEHAKKLRQFALPQPVTGVGILRRIQALRWLGYSSARIAKEAGVTAETICAGLNDNRTLWRQTTRDSVIAAYQRLWSRPLWSDTTGSASARSVASRAHRAAVKAGWVSPLAWDNIDDPNERPAGIGDPTQTRNRGNQIGRKNYLDESVIERRINGDRTARVNTLEATEIVRRLYREGRTGTWIRVHIGLKPERYLTLAAFHAELQKKQEAA